MPGSIGPPREVQGSDVGNCQRGVLQTLVIVFRSDPDFRGPGTQGFTKVQVTEEISQVPKRPRQQPSQRIPINRYQTLVTPRPPNFNVDIFGLRPGCRGGRLNGTKISQVPAPRIFANIERRGRGGKKQHVVVAATLGVRGGAHACNFFCLRNFFCHQQ